MRSATLAARRVHDNAIGKGVASLDEVQTLRPPPTPESTESIEAEACTILDVRELRDYLCMPGGFFADHLKHYSKSRRQAPIYPCCSFGMLRNLLPSKSWVIDTASSAAAAPYQQHLTSLCAGLGVRSATFEQLVKQEADRPEREAQRPVNVRGETRYLVPGILAYRDPLDLAAA